MLTEEAKLQHWEKFNSRVPRAVGQSISTGLSEEELWKIFSKLIEVVELLPDGEEIIFDVTHGFRSMQLLLQLGSAYLSSLKRVRVKHVLYGAYSQDQNPTPVLDLEPFLRLLDWANAANQFKSTGDARSFKPLIEAKYKTPLNDAAARMNEVSEALLLIRPDNLQKPAQLLESTLQKCSEISDPSALPFKLIASSIGEAFKPLAETNKIKRQLAQIEWYVRNGHYPLGVTLAREWMVTVRQEISNVVARSDSENWLNENCKSARETVDSAREIWRDFLSLWGELTQLRNDLNHCGERPHPSAPATVKKKAQELPKRLRIAVEPLNVI